MFLANLFNKNRININEAVANLEPDALLIDVREPDEYRSGHIPGSVNYPVGKIGNHVSSIPDKAAKIYVYCASGVRSSRAAGILKGAGFTDVTDLGGISAYRGKIEK